METALVVDSDTGEIVDTAFSYEEREDFDIPGELGDMVSLANESQRKVEGHSWRTAAMVYAWTEEGTGGPRKTGTKMHQLSLREFADLGIRGLSDWRTVSKYRKAMEWAVANGHCYQPSIGSLVSLPAIEFPSNKSIADNRRTTGESNNEWYTPSEYIASAVQVMGGGKRVCPR